MTVRLQLMIREVLESEADVPAKGNEQRGHIENKKRRGPSEMV